MANDLLTEEILALRPNSASDQELAVEIAAGIRRPGLVASDLYTTVKEQVSEVGSIGPFCVCLAARFESLDDSAYAFLQLVRVLGMKAQRELADAN